MIKTTLFQDWHLLENDKTIIRAMNKEGVSHITEYQYTHLRKAIRFCKRKRHCLDVGANIGTMSYHLAKEFKAVHAFEIQPEMQEVLELNMRKFPETRKKVITYPFGLSSCERLVSTIYNPKSTFGTHIDPKLGGGSILVKSLDSLQIENLDFIKLDVEGQEAECIRGGINTIKKYGPVILFENKKHSQRYNDTKKTVLDILEPLGYKQLDDVGSKNMLIGVGV